jgi:hypothetical protein
VRGFNLGAVGVGCQHADVGEIFIGSEALARGDVTRHELRRWYRAIYPDVYAPKRTSPLLRDRTIGAWLWSRRRAIIAGAAASALHGAQWVDAEVPIELIWNNGRPPSGLTVRNEALGEDEVTYACGLPVTTVTRTAFDLGRHLPRGTAIARLDALMRATPFCAEDVMLLAKRYRGARGLKRLRESLALVDGGAASPKETWLRLLLVDAGFPRPTTQIPVVDERGRLVRVLDMGWEDIQLAAEYDGDQHRTDRRQYVKDMRVLGTLESMRWKAIRVIAEDREDDVINRVERAFRQRGLRRD